jgi:hypothetical protein
MAYKKETHELKSYLDSTDAWLCQPRRIVATKHGKPIHPAARAIIDRAKQHQKPKFSSFIPTGGVRGPHEK